MFEDLVPNIRLLSADDLGIGVRAKAGVSHASSAPDAPNIESDHPRVQEIMRLAQSYGGVILTGPPGTSKTFFAAAAGQLMAQGKKERYRFVQFHASYQYEDFMLGFTPTETGFTYKEGPLLELAVEASKNEKRDLLYVLVIDELSRADVGRVFGEALTYVERSKRELPFKIASGLEILIPSNLVVIATMNPFDRGVDEVDAAFERRFAKVSMEPDRSVLDEMLIDNGMDDPLKSRVLGWFSAINGLAGKNPAAAVGHAYFSSASDEESLHDLWDYQLKYLVQRAFRRDEPTGADVVAKWKHIFQEPEPPEEDAEQATGEGT